jgi:hypothetical protein
MRCGSTLGDRHVLYKEYLEGCIEKYGPICSVYEEQRLFANSVHPEQTTVRVTNLYWAR